MSLRTELKATLRRNISLSSCCTMQVGGPAQYFADPATEDELIELLEFARTEAIPYVILGKGSNALFSDDGFPGLVISLLRYEQDKILFDAKTNRVYVSAGIFLYRFVLACRDNGLGGSEFLANIPGTVGGAVVMNAGFSRHAGQKNEIGDLIEEVHLLSPKGEKEIRKRQDLCFRYRSSNLGGCIVLGALLQLWPRDRESIQFEIHKNFEYRNREQDLKHPSSGSIFKNPPAPLPSAGKLIDQAGLKGLRIGGAMVSERHGNYIINAGRAKSSEVVELIRKVQQAVFDATGIKLETEVKIIEKS